MEKPNEIIRLTQYSHGGGCGCKIAPEMLARVLAAMPATLPYSDLLVGTETSDDAAVYRINDSQAIVATTDFFMPIVDDPYDFGRIAAANALSDIYAMGARPIFALAIVGMPINKLPIESIQQILAGGAGICKEAGIPIAGGHSIDSPEPIYGLVAIGLVNPEQLKRNNRAQPGDVLILGKALGIGILSAALKKEDLDIASYQEMLNSTTQLNTPGLKLGGMSQVHALTDVTGFGLAGHLLEICRGSKLAAEIYFDNLPVLDSALNFARNGYSTGASQRNWASYGNDVTLPEQMSEWQKNILSDPQTSGGLLVACAPESAQEVLEIFKQQGFQYASQIGTVTTGPPRITVR